jgi:NADP-dependent 3-hydroxy acid dehydrogenase YdfG
MSAERLAVVTGGSQGIGRAVASLLLGRGWRVVLLARDAARLAAAAEGFAAGDRADTLAADVAQAAQVEDAVARIMARHGRMDALVNSAGVSMRANRRLAESDPAEWQRIIETNLTGTYLMCRACLPHLERAPHADVVNIQSTASYAAKGGVGLYAASKYGVRALTESLIEEYHGSTVRITAVSPGPVDTTIWDRKLAPPDAATRAGMIRAQDIAEIVAWLIERPATIHIPNITVTPTRFRPG